MFVVTADRVYTQCPKALVRSRLWSADAQIARSGSDPGESIAALSKAAVDGAEYDAAYPHASKRRSTEASAAPFLPPTTPHRKRR